MKALSRWTAALLALGLALSGLGSGCCADFSVAKAAHDACCPDSAAMSLVASAPCCVTQARSAPAARLEDQAMLHNGLAASVTADGPPGVRLELHAHFAPVAPVVLHQPPRDTVLRI